MSSLHEQIQSRFPPRELLASHPLSLRDEGGLWYVVRGYADVFMLDANERRHFVSSFEAGSLLLGANGNQKTQMIATGSPDSQIAYIPWQDFYEFLKEEPTVIEAFGKAFAHWFQSLSNASAQTLRPVFKGEVCEETQEVKKGEHLCIANTEYCLRVESGTLMLRGDGKVRVPAGKTFPCGGSLWFEAETDTACSLVPLQKLIINKEIHHILAEFHASFVEVMTARISEAENNFRAQYTNEKQKNSIEWNDAIKRIEAVTTSSIESESEVSSLDDTLAALQYIGTLLKIKVVPHRDMLKGDAVEDPLRAIADASRFKTRRVNMSSGWHKENAGILLGYLGEELRPVALVPNHSGGYKLWDPRTKSTEVVTDEMAKKIAPKAYTIYRPLPEGIHKLKSILSFATFGSVRDIVSIVLLSIMVSVIGLLNPYITRIIFDDIIPSADRSQLFTVGCILIVSAVSSALFGLARSFALLRLETRSDSSLQAAIWDRLLGLPIPFFRRYSVGDLSERVLGIQKIRSALSGATLSGIITSLSAVLQVIMVQKYGGPLAVWAYLLVVIALLIMIISSKINLHFERQQQQVSGHVASLVFQIISGVNKLRLTGTERKAFIRWGNRFAEQRTITWKAETVNNCFGAFQGIYTGVCSVVIFYFAHEIIVKNPSEVGAAGGMSTGTFLAFNAAFSTLMGAVLGLGESVMSILNIVPLWERSKPILEESPETDEAKTAPHKLKGAIDVSGVCFRYDEENALILKNISVNVNPGEFVAIIGPSGSGKSTLLRVLLGFEKPESGAVFYDGYDLDSMDVRGVRKQIGTVLQNGKILQGDIFTNIVGSAPLTHEDAWEAADKAGFGDDVRAMPMGMHTVLNEGATTLSGGQRQRMLIARALVKKPSIIYFDEATSALDNRTQAVVSESLKQLNSTRVVIAHRLSTIRDADKIIVLKDGVVEEVGNFEELMKLKGIFAQMAERQIA